MRYEMILTYLYRQATSKLVAEVQKIKTNTRCWFSGDPAVHLDTGALAEHFQFAQRNATREQENPLVESATLITD